MATLSVVTISLSGGEPEFAAADAAGDEFSNTSGRTMFHAKNGSGVTVTVTAACQKACSYGFMHDAVVEIPAGEERIIGPFSPYRFNVPETRSRSRIARLLSDGVRYDLAST